MKNKLSHCLWTVVCLMILFTGCKSTKQAGSEGGTPWKEQHALLESLTRQQFEYRTLSARLKANVDLGNGKEVSSRVELKMIRDSLIQLSVQPFLGIEVFRLDLTTDRVRLVDRMGKRYVEEDYSGMRDTWKVDFDFYNLQALFVNHLFVPGERQVEEDLFRRFRMRRLPAYTELKVSDRSDLDYYFQIDREENLVAVKLTDKNEVFVLDWLYEDFQPLEKQFFPMQMSVDLSLNDKPAGSLSLSYARMEVDRPLKISTSVPPKYERISGVSLLKLLNL